MTDELYRRCPACLDAETEAPCPSCDGARFVRAGVTLRDFARLAEKGRRRWRIRIGTLMLLVVIAALASYIVAGWWHAALEARRREAEVRQALAELRHVEEIAAQATAQVQAKAPTPAKAGPTN
jgi:hypothetical protein